MVKTCENCQQQFKTKDSRQKSCSNACAAIRRAAWKATKSVAPLLPKEVATPTLPPPEELPAPYAKRVYDMWVALTEEAGPTRIA